MKGAADALKKQREARFDERQAGADDPETFYAEKVEGSLRKMKGDTWVADWIANHICKDHWSGPSRGRAGEFWRWAGYNQVRRMVAKETPAPVHLHAV